jgi:hypothetical protein
MARTTMVVFRAAAFAMVVLLGACGVGEVPIGGTGTPDAAGGGGAAAQAFNLQIRPLVTTSHTCLTCHNTNIAGEPNLTSVDTLQAKYKMKPGTMNILVTKGDHEGTTYFTADEKTTVASWIDTYGM